MGEFTDSYLCEGLRSFGGTDTRERFYEAAANRIESLSAEVTGLRETLRRRGKSVLPEQALESIQLATMCISAGCSSPYKEIAAEALATLSGKEES